MFVIDNLSSETLNTIVRKHVEKDTVIITDGSSSHVKFKEYFTRHEQHVEYDVDNIVKTSLP